MGSTHAHKYIYSDYVPGIGECKCGWVKVWNRYTQEHEEYKGEE